MAASQPKSLKAAKMQDFLIRCIRNNDKIFYRSSKPWEDPRPIKEYGLKPEDGWGQDCSGLTTLAYYWAGCPDPNGLIPAYQPLKAWTGYQICNPLVATGRYRIGDLAIYGKSRIPNDTEHVTICYSAGDAQTSRWASLGEDTDPSSRILNYRPDLVAVVRPGLN